MAMPSRFRYTWKLIVTGFLCGAVITALPQRTLAGAMARFTGSSVVNAITVDASGNLFVADGGQGFVYKITPQGVRTIVAGIGKVGFSGDGGPATAAAINASGVAVDRAGNLFIAGGAVSAVEATLQPMIATSRAQTRTQGGYDALIPGSGVVRKVTPDGIITTVAGTPGKPGWSGDGGKATSAQIIPYSLAVDASGNLFIAGDFVVRKVTPDGLISTVAGRGPAAAVFGYGFSGDGGPATAAQLNDALRIALDRTGNLFILDPANQRVRKVAPDGIITTVAGSGNTPTGAMANLNQSTIMGFIEGGFSGDGGPGTSARLRLPRGIATDGANNVYVVDNMRIRKLSTGGIITTIAGNGDSAETGDGGLAILAGVRTPNAIAVDVSGNVFLAYTISRIRKVTPEGSISTMQITTAQAPLKAPRFANIPPLPWAAGLALLALLAAYTRMH